MKYFLRQCENPFKSLGILAVACLALAIAPGAARAQLGGLIPFTGRVIPAVHAGSQVYLGVEIADVDPDKAQALKLKDARGALVTLIDHDAPAAKAGIVVNDVILAFNGQQVQNVEQFLSLLHQTHPGNKVSIEISRDGNLQTLAVQLTDRRALDHEVWTRIGNGGDVFPQAPAMGVFPGSSDAPVPGGFHMSFFGKTLNVGAMVEPLTSQMAEYLGIASGLMVKQVARKSEAAIAGLKSFDVIVKAGSEAVTNIASWDRALRANQGKPIQVTVLRDRKAQVLTLLVDSRHPESKSSPGTPTPATVPAPAAPLNQTHP